MMPVGVDSEISRPANVCPVGQRKVLRADGIAADTEAIGEVGLWVSLFSPVCWTASAWVSGDSADLSSDSVNRESSSAFLPAELSPGSISLAQIVVISIADDLATWSASAILSLIFQLCFYVANVHLAAHFIPILVSKLVY